MFRRKLLMVAAVLGGLFVPAAANAASFPAVTTADLNIRVGPGVQYERFSTIPAGDNIHVNSCLSGYNWCDVSWAGTRGWVSGNYLAYLGQRYYRRPIPTIATVIGLPVVRYDYNDYYGRHYRGHVFRGHRFHDRFPNRAVRHERSEHRRDIRHDRRERTQEIRQHRRERTQEIRQDRRERQQHIRQNRRERRQDVRQHRRDHRQEVRKDRREDRRDVRKERRRDRRGN